MTAPLAVSGFVDRPDYRVDILRRRNEVTATLGDVVIARSRRAFLVDEQDHGLVFYFPRDDVLVELTRASDAASTCPYKGDATHWRIDGDRGSPLAWSYDHPYEQVSSITGHIAFYQDRVTVALGVATPAVVGYRKG